MNYFFVPESICSLNERSLRDVRVLHFKGVEGKYVSKIWKKSEVINNYNQNICIKQIQNT